MGVRQTLSSIPPPKIQRSPSPVMEVSNSELTKHQTGMMPHLSQQKLPLHVLQPTPPFKLRFIAPYGRVVVSDSYATRMETVRNLTYLRTGFS